MLTNLSSSSLESSICPTSIRFNSLDVAQSALQKVPDSQKNTLGEIKQNVENIKESNGHTLKFAQRSSSINQQILKMRHAAAELRDIFKISLSSRA